MAGEPKTKKEKEIYRREWNKEHYSRIGIYIKPETKAEWQEYANKKGFRSLNNFVIHCVESVVHPDDE